MAVCPTYANPSRTRRTLCLVAIEQTPGCTVTILSTAVTGAKSAGLEQTTLYENFNPLAAEFDTIAMNRARTGLGPEGFAIGIGTFRFTGSVYVVGSGYSNMSPVWAKVLQACGWWEERYVNDTAPDLTGLTPTAGAGGNMTPSADYWYAISTVDTSVNKRESRLTMLSSKVALGGGHGSVAFDFSTGADTALDTGSPRAQKEKIRIYRTVGDTATTIYGTDNKAGKLYFVAEVDCGATYTDTIGDSQLGEEAPVPLSCANDTTITYADVASGGNMSDGTPKYKLVLVSPIGTLLKKSAEKEVTVNGGGSSQKVTIDWTADSEIYRQGYTVKVYRTIGAGTGDFKYVGSQLATASSGIFTDTLADSALGTTIPTDPVLTGAEMRWIPLNEAHKSLSFKNMLDGISYVAGGVRGTMNFTAEAGQPMKGDIDLQGSYNDGTLEANIGALSNPGVPPRLLDISCYLYDSDAVTYNGAGTGGAKKLIVKSVGVNLGATPSRRTDAQTDSGIIEYGLFGEFAPRITLQVEVLNDANHTVDFLKKFRQGVRYYVEFTVSDSGTEDNTPGSHITFYTSYADADGTPGANDIVPSALSFNAQLAEPPTFGDVENIRTWNLTFVPGEIGTENAVASNFMMMRHW